MSTQVRCHCQSCTIRGLVGPVLVITAGILFLLDRLHGGHFDFGSTYPVLLVVAGLLLLGSSVVSREGHIEAAATPGPQTPPPAPQGNAPQTPYSGQGQ